MPRLLRKRKMDFYPADPNLDREKHRSDTLELIPGRFVQTLNKSLASGDYVLYRCVRHRKPLSTFPRPNAKACGCRAYVSFKYVPDGVWVSRSTEHQNHTIDHECYGLDHNKEKVVQKLNCIIKTLKSKDAIVSPDFLDGLRQLEYQCSHQICQLKSESDMTVTIE